jgi:hypothetical protein
MKNTVSYFITVVCAVVLFAATQSAPAQTPQLRVNNQQLENLLNRIDDKVQTLQNTLNRNPANDQYWHEGLISLVQDFASSTESLRTRVDSRQGSASEATDVLNKASLIDRFVTRNRLGGTTATQWRGIKSDLNTLASYYRLNWNWDNAANSNTGYPAYTATDTQLRNLISQIETKTNNYKQAMDNSLDRSSINNTNSEDSINSYIGRFEDATDRLKDRFGSRQSTVEDASEVLNRARYIDQFMARSRMNRSAENQWSSLRRDLNTLANYYRVSWNWNQTGNLNTGYSAYTATDAQLRRLISQIESKTNNYKNAMDNSLDRSNINNTNSEDSINSYIGKFEDATDRLKDRFGSRQSTVEDASEVLNRARYIDQFMAGSPMNRNAQNHWSSLRTDLNTLASYYRVSWNWNEPNPVYPSNTFPTSGIDARMTGTYRLNAGRSDNVADVINRSLGNYSNDQRDNVRQNLERRLRSPEMIAIERRGRTVSMASSNSPQVTFEADGVAKSETNDRGRTVTTTATSNNNGLLINYEGDRMNDFFVTFSPSGNGQLNVSRRIYLENRNETVTVSSVYDKVNNSPQWSNVNSGSVANTAGTGDFYIANGTRIDATLREMVNTKSSQAGDRFVMDVTSPGQYQGAVIEGRVAQAGDSGRFSGRANISFDFDTITMNGRTYRFAGIIESVTAANGDTVSVNNEGTVRDSSQTTQTATRAGIGAVLGAIIGAVAGGGKGAAIGAAVGGGAGAGSVLITGRDSIELGAGSVFNITASAPTTVGVNR